MPRWPRMRFAMLRTPSHLVLVVYDSKRMGEGPTHERYVSIPLHSSKYITKEGLATGLRALADKIDKWN